MNIMYVCMYVCMYVYICIYIYIYIYTHIWMFPPRSSAWRGSSGPSAWSSAAQAVLELVVFSMCL